MLASSGAGCASILQSKAEPDPTAGLPPVRAPLQSVQLELLFVERPVNDPLLGSPLWSEMDQLAGIPAAERLSLSENGFRVGFCGTEAPATLAALLAEVGEDAYDDLAGFLTGRRVVLRRGAMTEVQSTISPRSWNVELVRGGTPTPARFNQSRGVFRVELVDIEDGWADVRITPEVHHGDLKSQPSPGVGGWQIESRQDIEVLAEAAFQMRLSLGELLVLSADETGTDRLGNQFFRREEKGRLMQRVLVLRIARIGRGTESLAAAEPVGF